MILAGYLIKKFLQALGGVTLGISVLYFLVEIESHISLFGDLGFSAIEIVGLTILKTPESIYTVLPIIVALAALWMSWRLSASREMSVIRASGKSGISTLAIPAAAAFVAGTIIIGALNPLISVMASKHNEIVNQDFNSDRQIYIEEGGLIWLRQVIDGRQTVMRATRTVGGELFEDVHVFMFDPDGLPTRRFYAASAELLEDVKRESENIPYSAISGALESSVPGFCFYGLKIWESSQRSDESSMEPIELNVDCLASLLTPAQIRESLDPPNAVPVWKLNAQIELLEETGFSSVIHRLYLHSELAKPLLLAALVLLGGCFTLRPTQSINMPVMITATIILILGVTILGNFAQIMGESQEIPVAFAAWLPPLVVLAFSMGVLFFLEDG